MPETATPVPRGVRWAAWIVLVAGAVVCLVGGWRIGVTWDEPLHVQRYNHYVETGWYLGDGQVEYGRPTPDMDQQYVYGPATMLLLHGLGRVAGTDEASTASATASGYAVRHLGIALIGLIGAFAVGATCRILLRSWEWGLVASAALVATPLWNGHAMFNVKDVPVATGYALATLGLVMIARPDRATATRWYPLLSSLALAAGTVLAVGTRPGMWTGIAASCGAAVVCWGLRPGTEPLRARLRQDLWRWRELAFGVGVAGLTLFAIYPKVFSSPVTALTKAAFGSANFLDASAPWTFVPVRVALQIPLFVIGFAAVGTVIAIRQVVRRRLRPEPADTRRILLLVQMLTLPLIAIVHGANLYGDLRQLLFSTPATVVLAVLGLERLVAWAKTPRRRRAAPVVAWLAAVGLVAPLAQQVLVFPYGYISYNSLAALAGVVGDGDYYRASGRELVESVPTSGRIVCTPQTDEDGRVLRVAHLDGWVECAGAQSSPISAYADDRAFDAPQLGEDEFWAISFNRANRAAENCTRLTSVRRWTPLGSIRLASLLRCQREFPALSPGTVEFTARPQSGVDVPDLGWYSFGVDGTTTGIRSRGGPSTWKFSFDESLAESAVRFRFVTTVKFPVDVTFEGEPLATRWTAGPRPVLTVEVPPDAVAATVTRPGTLEFTSSISEPLHLKIWEYELTAVEPGQD